MASWVEQSAWWHIYPLGFLGAEKNALQEDGVTFSRLRKLEPWLDYLLELGCNGLLLAPIFSSSTHGYDTVDHYTIDARLGTDADFDWLIEKCKEKGIRVVLDGVFNHVGRQFAPFADVQVLRGDSKFASWFHIDWHNTHNEDGFAYRNFEGHNQLVTLNHDNPEVLEYVVQVMTYWLRKGVDGWRLDAAYAVPQHFWHKVIDRVKGEFPDAWILGEVIHGDYSSIARAASFDSITQYELWKAIWSALNDRNFFELSHALGRHNEFLNSELPNVFLGNHDVTRIATQLKNVKHLDLALVVSFTAGGVPSIYAGDEQAFRGLKEHRADGDDDIRTKFPDTPAEFMQEGWETHQKYKTLLQFRRENAVWLARARSKVLTLSNMFLVYEVSSRIDSNRLIVALNCGDTSVVVNDRGILPVQASDVVFGALTDGSKIEANSAAVWTMK